MEEIFLENWISILVFVVGVILFLYWGKILKFFRSKKTSTSKSKSGTSTTPTTPARRNSGKWLRSLGWFGTLLLRFVIIVVVVAILTVLWDRFVEPKTRVMIGPDKPNYTAPVEHPVPGNHIYNFSDTINCPDGRCPVPLGCGEFCWGTDPIGGDVVLEVRRDNGFERVGMDELNDGNTSFGFLDPKRRVYYLRAATKEETTSDSLATGVVVYWYKTGYH